MKMRSIALALGALALVAPACGSDDNGNAGSSTNTTLASPATTVASGNGETAGTTAPAVTNEPATTEAPSTPEGDPDAVLRVGYHFLRSGSYSFDQLLYNGNNASVWMYQVFAPLVNVDPNTLEYTPYLAESFEVIDPQTLEMTLRPDATFHDGRPVTAEDAKFSLEKARDNQAEGLNNLNGSIQLVASVEVVDDLTYRVVFSKPAVLTMYEMMAGPEMFISPADSGAEQATNPIGNGRFRFVSHVQDQKFTLERWDDFFDAATTPYGGIEFVNLTPGAAQTSALLAGDIDVANDVGVEGYEAIEASDAGEAFAVVGNVRYSFINLCGAPGYFWESADLRLAVEVGTDREQLNEALYNGLGSSMNQFFPKGHPYHDDALDEEYAYDPDRARELRVQAGVEEGATDGFFATNALPESEDLGLLLNQQWGEWGINLEVIPSDDLVGDFLLPAMNEPFQLDRGHSAMIENTRSGLQRLTRQSDLKSIVNSCLYANPRFAEIAEEIPALNPDNPKAAALWKEASRIAIEDGYFVILNQKPNFPAVSARVGGVDSQGDFHGSTEGGYQYDEWFIKTS